MNNIQKFVGDRKLNYLETIVIKNQILYKHTTVEK